MDSTTLSKRISELALDKKGYEVKIMDMKEITDTTDFFVVITGDTDIHVRAIADYIEDSLKKDGVVLWRKEGYKTANWILLDYIDVVTHIFKPDKRDYYNLDNLWADAKVKLIRDGV